LLTTQRFSALDIREIRATVKEAIDESGHARKLYPGEERPNCQVRMSGGHIRFAARAPRSKQ
jgi:hypothetical protein